MTDEVSFLAAIAENPKDENLPLVFADWLDDHGDPRGQWIRNWTVRPWMEPTFQNPIPMLLESLRKDKKVIEVRRAAEVIGEPIVPGLIELLKHEKSRVREQACMCLRRIGKRAKAAVPALIELLSDADYSVRGSAAKAIQDIGADEGTGTNQLKAALTDDNWRVRQAASKVLGKMRAKGDVLEELVERLESPDEGDRIETVDALAQLGTKDALAPLDGALNDPKAAVREAAVQALGRLKLAGVVPSLCRAMTDRAASVRKTAAEQFSHYSSDVPYTEEAVASLTKLLADSEADVRATACYRLSGAGSLAARAIPHLIVLLDDNAEVQIAAARALAELARGDKAALDALIDKTTASEKQVRVEVVRAVGIVGRDNPAALAALMRRLDDRSEDVVAAAVEQLREWAKLPASVVPPLLERFTRLHGTQEGYYTSHLVLVALGRIESPPPEVLVTLREAVRNPHGYELMAALEALAKLGPAATPAIPELVGVFHSTGQSHGYYIYHAVVKALVSVGPKGIEELTRLIEESNDNARWYIFQCFGELREAALPLLPAMLRRLEKTTDEYQRGRLIDAIATLGPGAAAAIPTLLDGATHWQPAYARAGAISALSRFGDALLPYLPRLVELSCGRDGSDSRRNFALLFAQFAPRVPDVKEPLSKLLRAAAPGNPDDWNERWARKDVRRTCASALLAFKDASVLPDIAPMLADPEVDIRRDFVYQLDQLDTPAVLPLIRQALDDTDDDVRLRAIEVLGRRNDASPETVAGLVEAVDDRVPKIRRAAIDLLGKLKVGTDAVQTALAAAMEDADKKVAERARIALKKVTPKEPKAKARKTKGKKKAE